MKTARVTGLVLGLASLFVSSPSHAGRVRDRIKASVEQVQEKVIEALHKRKIEPGYELERYTGLRINRCKYNYTSAFGRAKTKESKLLLGCAVYAVRDMVRHGKKVFVEFEAQSLESQRTFTGKITWIPSSLANNADAPKRHQIFKRIKFRVDEIREFVQHMLEHDAVVEITPSLKVTDFKIKGLEGPDTRRILRPLGNLEVNRLVVKTFPGEDGESLSSRFDLYVGERLVLFLDYATNVKLFAKKEPFKGHLTGGMPTEPAAPAAAGEDPIPESTEEEAAIEAARQADAAANAEEASSEGEVSTEEDPS